MHKDYFAQINDESFDNGDGLNDSTRLGLIQNPRKTIQVERLGVGLTIIRDSKDEYESC